MNLTSSKTYSTKKSLSVVLSMELLISTKQAALSLCKHSSNKATYIPNRRIIIMTWSIGRVKKVANFGKDAQRPSFSRLCRRSSVMDHPKKA